MAMKKREVIEIAERWQREWVRDGEPKHECEPYTFAAGITLCWMCGKELEPYSA